MNNAHILVIEDEQDIRDLIFFQMKSEGYAVSAVESADKAMSLIEKNQPIDLFIIDWMLPGSLNGLEFTKKLKSHKNYKATPIIMITALTQADNIVAGLDAGADDYVTKPFDIVVLRARVRAQIRSHSLPNDGSADLLNFGTLKIETTKCRVFIQNEEINLTSTEFKILLLLSQNPGHVYTREQFINNIQGEGVFVTGRTIDTHIAGLRKKLGEASSMIETIRGIGYRFKDAI